MKFSVKINGVDFLDFDVEDPIKAAELVNVLTEACSKCEIKSGQKDVFGESQIGTIEFVLNGLRGTKTSSFIKLLAGLDGFGATDTIIKKKMPKNGRDINLAPYIASISKACKRGDVEFSEVLIRNEKRIRPGKVIYHYQLTKKAAEFVNSIEDYEKDEYFEERDEPVKDEAVEPDDTGLFDDDTGLFDDDDDAGVDPCHSGSNRSRVRAAADGNTIKKMTQMTGLSKEQVRAVVNANVERLKYKKRKLNTGEMEYTFLGN